MMTFEERLRSLAEDPSERDYVLPHGEDKLVLPRSWPELGVSSHLVFEGHADLMSTRRYAEGHFVDSAGQRVHPTYDCSGVPGLSGLAWWVPWKVLPKTIPVAGQQGNLFFLDDVLAELWRSHAGECVRIFRLPLLLKDGVESGRSVNIAIVVAVRQFIDFENTGFELRLYRSHVDGALRHAWSMPGPLTLRTDVDQGVPIAWHRDPIPPGGYKPKGPLFISRELASAMLAAGYIATYNKFRRTFAVEDPAIYNSVYCRRRWQEVAKAN